MPQHINAPFEYGTPFNNTLTLEQSQLQRGSIPPTVLSLYTGTSLQAQSGSVGELQVKTVTEEVEPQPWTAIIGDEQSIPQ